MPTYEYECRQCSHHFEAFQAMSDEPLKICPECGKEVRRLILGGTGVIFKGSGFYVTDKNKGRNGASRSKPKTDGASSGEAASVSGDKTDSCAQCPNKASGSEASSGTGCPAGKSTFGREGGLGDKKNKASPPAASA